MAQKGCFADYYYYYYYYYVTLFPQVTKAPQPGEKRSATSFDIRLSTLNEATVDILFSKNKVCLSIEYSH
jgi:hypothetical protein